MKTGEDMIPPFGIRNNFRVCAEAAGFFRNNSAHAVHSGFIARGRFGFDQSFEKRFHVHGLSLKGKVEYENNSADQRAIGGEDV